MPLCLVDVNQQLVAGQRAPVYNTLVVDGAKRTEPPETLPPPPLIARKDQIWHSVSNAISP
jgi:hypothetical protein